MFLMFTYLIYYRQLMRPCEGNLGQQEEQEMAEKEEME